MKNFWLNPEDFDKAYCSAWVATAIVGSAVVGGAVSAYSANKAAGAQKEAANIASQTQLQGSREANALLERQYNQTRADLSDYRYAGSKAIGDLNANPDLMLPVDIPQEMLDLRKPLNITQEELEKLPGYQFARTQGLKAVQNSAASRGLGTSGAALKGAANFATGLADQNYATYFGQQQQNVQNAFGRYDTTLGRQIQNRQTAFDRLKGLIDTGAGAAGATAQAGTYNALKQSGNITGAASGVASNTIGAGNAEAGGIMATGNAISNAANNIGGYAAYKGLYGGGIKAAGAPGDPSNPTGYSTNPWSSSGQYSIPVY